jgi:hypothetical protein
MSRRRVTAASFVVAVLIGGAAGLLFGLLWAADRSAPVTPTPTTWPTAYRCGAVWQPEDLDRADRCVCESCK